MQVEGRGPFPDRCRDICLPHRVKNGCGAYPASYALIIMGFSLVQSGRRVKQICDAECAELYLHACFTYMSIWRF